MVQGRRRGGGAAAIAMNTGDDDDESGGLQSHEHDASVGPGSSLFEDSVSDLDFRGGGSGSQHQSRKLSATGGSNMAVTSTALSGRGKQKGELTVYDYIPKSYQYSPNTADPILYYMPKTMNSLQHQAKQAASAQIAAQQKMVAAGQAIPNTTPPISSATAPTGATLRTLLNAAEEDVRLHRARAKAALDQDLRRLRTYRLENDPVWMKRKEILEERNTTIDQLQTDAQTIWNDLLQAQDDSKKKKELEFSPAERQQLQLARWQKALELFVYCPLPSTYAEKAEEGAKAKAKAEQEQKDGKKKKKDKKKDNEPPPVVHPLPDVMDPAMILDSLLEQGAGGGATSTAGGTTSADEDDMSAMLQEASNMCQSLVEITHKQCASAAQQVLSQEESYSIRLEAHELFLRTALTKCEEIQDQFQVNGRAALQIGHQLEFAETKRRQCEATSKLIRLWWMLEALAEEEARTGNAIKVEEEVRGVIPPTSCRMNPLFVRPEQSLEAARALKQLRAVVRSRGNATTSTSGAAAVAATATPAVPGAGTDQSPIQRFDWTANLITRTSDALEQRLLHSFSEIYAQGGSYDFSLKPRPGSIDWRELQALAEALLMFDSGRNLHKRYVDMVITSRFPELFEKKATEKKSGRHQNKTEETFDMDATRSTLSSLFHKVSDVCSAEFELIAHVFGSDQTPRADSLEGNEPMPLVVARALLQRVISDPTNGLQAKINDILASIDQRGDFDAGSKKLDTFVIIHEKAAGLFALLKDSAQKMILKESAKKSADSDLKNKGLDSTTRQSQAIARNAVESLKGFLTSQELSLSNTHRQGYINLELRLLHHECCSSLDKAGCTLNKPPPPRRLDTTLAEKGILEEYRAPILPLDKPSLFRAGLQQLLHGPLKQSVLRQPLVHAADSLARARLMFGSGKKKGGETTARVVCSIYSQMCSFYGEGFLYPIMEVLRDSRKTNPPKEPPQLPFDEDQPAHDLGVEQAFWVSLERLQSAAKAFDREMWAEGRPDTGRVWEILDRCDDQDSMSKARACRFDFYTELERRGETAIMTALDSISAHIHWILVSGGEGTTTNRFALSGSNSAGPYAVPQNANMDSPSSPAVQSLAYCLRVQFVQIQSALTPHSFSGFWTALSMRLYDILVARLLKHYQVSQTGAAILQGDVDTLRSVSMLAGTQHDHWDMLRELITLYMIPPDSVKNMLVGPEGDITLGKGLFGRAGRDQCLVFLSRRVDYRFKQGNSLKRSGWAETLLNQLGVSDPSDQKINLGLFAAERKP